MERRDQLRDVGRLRLQDTVERPARGMGPPERIVIDRLTFKTVAASARLEKTSTAEIVAAAITKQEERRRVTSGTVGAATFLPTKGVGLAWTRGDVPGAAGPPADTRRAEARLHLECSRSNSTSGHQWVCIGLRDGHGAPRPLTQKSRSGTSGRI